MWEFLGKLVESLPPWFLAAVVVFLLAEAAWILPRLRRDKNGKLYIYSRSYEHQKNRIKQQSSLFDEIKNDITRLDDRTKSIELENLKQTFYINNETFPKDERLIAGLKYVYSGGNGATRADVARFVAENPEVHAGVMERFPQWALKQEGGDKT